VRADSARQDIALEKLVNCTPKRAATCAAASRAFLPEDLHSIHIEAPLLNFHMYGLALEQLVSREFYKEKERRWDVFPPHSDIREARW